MQASWLDFPGSCDLEAGGSIAEAFWIARVHSAIIEEGDETLARHALQILATSVAVPVACPGGECCEVGGMGIAL